MPEEAHRHGRKSERCFPSPREAERRRGPVARKSDGEDEVISPPDRSSPCLAPTRRESSVFAIFVAHSSSPDCPGWWRRTACRNVPVSVPSCPFRAPSRIRGLSYVPAIAIADWFAGLVQTTPLRGLNQTDQTGRMKYLEPAPFVTQLAQPASAVAAAHPLAPPRAPAGRRGSRRIRRRDIFMVGWAAKRINEDTEKSVRGRGAARRVPSSLCPPCLRVLS